MILPKILNRIADDRRFTVDEARAFIDDLMTVRENTNNLVAHMELMDPDAIPTPDAVMAGDLTSGVEGFDDLTELLEKLTEKFERAQEIRQAAEDLENAADDVCTYAEEWADAKDAESRREAREALVEVADALRQAWDSVSSFGIDPTESR